MYADRITNSMQKTMDETTRRRAIQMKYNADNGMVPTQIVKAQRDIIGSGKEKVTNQAYQMNDEIGLAADPVVQYMSKDEIEKSIERVKSRMVDEAKNENFMEAAVLRDEMFALKKLLLEKTD